MNGRRRRRAAVNGTLLIGVVLSIGTALAQNSTALPRAQRVLLISVDGMHEQDLREYVAGHPMSALASLSSSGVTYSQAHTSVPSDSFPGLLALVTGGTPRSTGVYYDDSYDRRLAAAGSDCKVAGTEVVYDESIDKNPDLLESGGIDPTKLPRDPANGCAPLYPHSFLRVNTVFEVARAAGLPTAWADKHPAYDLIQGPSGNGVDDLYTPEINNAGNPTDSEVKTAAYDALKVKAVLNQIGGRTSAGEAGKIPAIFGMNFQALSVAQKTTGYAAQGTPGPDVAAALDFVDTSLGQMVAGLKAGGLMDSTLVVISAKHGQSPINRSALKIVDSEALKAAIEAAAPAGLAQLTTDSVGLVWLKDGTQADAVTTALIATQGGPEHRPRPERRGPEGAVRRPGQRQPRSRSGGDPYPGRDLHQAHSHQDRRTRRLQRGRHPRGAAGQCARPSDKDGQHPGQYHPGRADAALGPGT